MFLPPILTVAWATDRSVLRYRMLVLEKLYFDRIKFPSRMPGAFAAKCQYHVRPVFWFMRLTRLAMSSGGISHKPTKSGLTFAIQVAMRFQFVTPSVP